MVILNPSIIIPSLKLDFRIRVLEFASNGMSSLRPISVSDQTQKFADLTLATGSNAIDDSTAPLTTHGAYLFDRIPLGSVDPSTASVGEAAAAPCVRDLHSSMLLSSSTRDEWTFASEVLKMPFTPHVATLIVSVPSHQLESISPCQLQITFINNGQFIYLNHSENHPPLAPAPSFLAMKILDILPRPIKYFRDNSATELFSLQIEMSSERLRAFALKSALSDSEARSPEFNNYRFSVSYLPRTNFSFQNYTCPTEPQFSIRYAKLLSNLEPLSRSVHVAASIPYPSPPFQVVVSSEAFQFVAVVSSKVPGAYLPPPSSFLPC
jgi:hypothetical protein